MKDRYIKMPIKFRDAIDSAPYKNALIIEKLPKIEEKKYNDSCIEISQIDPDRIVKTKETIDYDFYILTIGNFYDYNREKLMLGDIVREEDYIWQRIVAIKK